MEGNLVGVAEGKFDGSNGVKKVGLQKLPKIGNEEGKLVGSEERIAEGSLEGSREGNSVGFVEGKFDCSNGDRDMGSAEISEEGTENGIGFESDG